MVSSASPWFAPTGNKHAFGPERRRQKPKVVLDGEAERSAGDQGSLVTASTALKSQGQSQDSAILSCTSIHEKAPFLTAEENIHGEKRTKYRKRPSPRLVGCQALGGGSSCAHNAVSNREGTGL